MQLHFVQAHSLQNAARRDATGARKNRKIENSDNAHDVSGYHQLSRFRHDGDDSLDLPAGGQLWPYSNPPFAAQASDPSFTAPPKSRMLTDTSVMFNN